MYRADLTSGEEAKGSFSVFPVLAKSSDGSESVRMTLQIEAFEAAEEAISLFRGEEPICKPKEIAVVGASKGM